MINFRSLLLNRLSIFALLSGLVIASVNIYVSYHNDGILRGRVSDTAGIPIEGAEVTLYMPALIGLEPIDTQFTNKSGEFRFVNHGQHHPALRVLAAEYEESNLHRIRLYFRNQNRIISQNILVHHKDN